MIVPTTCLAELRRNARPPGQSLVSGGALASPIDAFCLVDGRTASLVFGAGRLAENDVDAVIGGDVRVVAWNADADTQCTADG